MSGSHVGKMSMVLPQPQREREREMVKGGKKRGRGGITDVECSVREEE